MSERICRICSNKTKIPIKIFSKTFAQNGVGLEEMYQKCCQLHISEDDSLPQQICIKCLNELKSAYDLFQKANVSHRGFLKEKEKEQKLMEAEKAKKQNTKRKFKKDNKDMEENHTNEIKLPKIDLIDSYIEKESSSKTRIMKIQSATDCTTESYLKIDGTKINCRICNKSFLTAKALVFHTKLMHKNIVYT